MMKNLYKLKCPKIPVIRKCCFCIPTYVGIAVFGYADLNADKSSGMMDGEFQTSGQHQLITRVWNSLSIVCWRRSVVVETLALVAFPMLMYEMVDELTSDKPHEGMHYSDPAIHLPVIVTAALADIVLTVVLLIGAHRKNKLMLKIYFYFATVSQLITLLADLPFFDYTEYKKNVLYIFFVGLNIYLLFLVHNVVYVREESREIQYIAYEQHRTNV